MSESSARNARIRIWSGCFMCAVILAPQLLLGSWKANTSTAPTLCDTALSDWWMHEWTTQPLLPQRGERRIQRRATLSRVNVRVRGIPLTRAQPIGTLGALAHRQAIHMRATFRHERS